MSDKNKDLMDLLISWNSAHQINNLTDENITIDVLKIITVDQLEELTRDWKIGDKVVFTYHFQIWRNEINLPVPLQNKITKISSLGHLKRSSSVLSQDPLSQSSCYSSDTDDCDVNVLDILKETTSGCRIIESYEANKHLFEKQRSLAITIIAQYFEKNRLHMSLKSSYSLEQQLLQIFPNEKLEYYRTDRRGKIYMKFQNLKKAGKNIFTCEDDIPTSSKNSKMQLVPEEDASLMINSLKFDNLSAEEFESTWSACSQYRLNSIMNDCKNLKEVFKMWPQYKTPTGYKLIDKDFTTLHKPYNPISNWDQKVLDLFNYLQRSKPTNSQNERKTLNAMSAEDYEKDSDKFILKTLYALHSWLYPTGRYLRKNVSGKLEMSRYTIKDSQESFLFLDNTMPALQTHIQFLHEKGENIQPFILGVGNIDKVAEFYVYLDIHLLPFTNFQRSLDICFKSFHLFNLEYPKPSETFWCFIEQYFFEIKTNSKKHSKVVILIDDINKHM